MHRLREDLVKDAPGRRRGNHIQCFYQGTRGIGRTTGTAMISRSGDIKHAGSSGIYHGLSDFIDLEGVLSGVEQIVHNDVDGGHVVTIALRTIARHQRIDQRMHLPCRAVRAGRADHHLGVGRDVINQLQHEKQVGCALVLVHSARNGIEIGRLGNDPSNGPIQRSEISAFVGEADQANHHIGAGQRRRR